MDSENHDLDHQWPIHPATHAQFIILVHPHALALVQASPASSKHEIVPGSCFLLVSVWLWGLLYLRFGTWFLLTHNKCLTTFKSSGFFLPPKYLWLFIYSFPILFPVLTIGINSIIILLLKLGTGNIFNVLISVWFWTPWREGLSCVSIFPFVSSGSALRRCQCHVFMGCKIIRLGMLFISCARVRTWHKDIYGALAVKLPGIWYPL